MPASRPQHPDRHTKTKTAAPSTTTTSTPVSSTEQTQSQHQHAIVSSPLSSPTNPHQFNRFSGPPPSLSLARSQQPQSKGNSHATDTSIKSLSETEHPIVPVLPSSESVSSTSSSHSFSNNRNITSNGRVLNPSQAHEQKAQLQAQSESQTQMIALAEARLFAQQLHQQQQQQQLLLDQQNSNQFSKHLDASRRASLMGAGPRSVVGSLASGRGSTTTSAVGGMSPVLAGGGVGSDEPVEQTLLLVRPVWILDQDAAACRICTRTFNTVRRKHHCRQCGHIFCHDCSSRSIALPQLGYTKAVRVCNDCFEVAYLVAYCLSDDLGPSTQIHGARGLYELVETNDAKTLDSILEHGGLDAMVYLCSVVHGYELHAWATKSLAALADNQAFQNTIVAKRAMPKLFHLVSAYAYHITSPLRPPSPPMPLTRMASTASLHTKGIRRIETIATVMMNITHIVFQMVADRLLASQLVMEGAVDGLMCLSVYFPAGVRTRAMEHAIRSVSIARDDVADDGADTPLSGSQRNSEDGRSQRPASQQTQGEDDEDETGLVSMDDIFHVQLEHMQGQAAKCLSVLAADVSNQAFIVDDPERIDRLVQLLYSNNPDVVKYASKTMAYLSLRNDRYKPDIVKGTGAAALLTVIRTGSENHALSEGNSLSEAVSHACCALANLATNTESQEILMSHLDLLHTTCTVVGQFPHQREIERHVARLIANLALYDQNKLSLLTAYSSPSDTILDPSQSLTHQHQQHPAVPHRYSSPPPPARRAKGNVIPTLLYIGALTLERAGAVGNSDDEQSYPHHGQDVIDFMNDDRLAARTDPGYLTPNDSLTEEDVSAQDLDYGEHARSVNEEAIAEWATVPGMEDVQRHIIRAIDNLITSVMDDPASNQSFKVFSRIWPTLGLIKTIQMTNQDEDTQRRASHVLSTLVHQQQIHADTIVALKQQSTLSEDISQPAPVVAEYLKQEGESAESKLKEDEELEQQRQVAEEAEKAKTLEQAQLEKEKLVKDQIEKKQKEKSERKAAKERLEKEQAEERSRQEAERLEKERTEQERVEQECIEQERIEQERAEQERLEQKRLEQEHLEQERLEKERHEEERVEKERIEKERIEKERIEKERIEKERVEQERIEKKLVEQTRIEKERVEQERIEKERVEQERIEKERVEQARIEQKRLKKETLEREQKEREREDRRASERRKVEDEHDEDSAFESLKAENKGGSSSEDQTTSFDDEPKPKEKGKKKKKKHAK